MVKVLIICMGNICRSPLVQGVLEQRLREEGLDEHVTVDSAGTHAYHLGKAPDPRSIEAAARRNIDISRQRSRQIQGTDFEAFDLILAMDRENESRLRASCPPRLVHKVRLFLRYAPELAEQQVPDPYYGDVDDFEKVLDMAELAVEGLLDALRERHA